VSDNAESVSATSHPESGTQEYREQVQEQLREEGHDDFAEWVNGPKLLTDFTTEDFLAIVEDAWVVQLVGSSTTHQFTTATTGDLITCADGDQDGDFGRAHKAFNAEFRDYLMSGQYRIELLFPEDSAFEVADDG